MSFIPKFAQKTTNQCSLANTKLTMQINYTTRHTSFGDNRTEFLHHISAFARYLDAQWAGERPDVAHAHSPDVSDTAIFLLYNE